MILNFSRILMAEADAAAGAPAPVAAAEAAPAIVPQAQGAVPLAKDVSDAIASAVTSAIGGLKDSIFAEARRTFTGAKPSKATKTDEAAPAAPSASEERTLLRGLDRALSQLGVSPSNAQYARAERDLLSDRPESVDSWARDYFDGWKGAQPAAQAAPVTQPSVQAAPARNAAPVSDRGSPPVSATPLEEQDLLSMTPSDRDALRKLKGEKWFTDRILEQSRTRSFRLR